MKENGGVEITVTMSYSKSGKIIDAVSFSGQPSVGRAIFAMVKALADTYDPRNSKHSDSDHDRRQKNIAKGHPPMAGLPWSDEDTERLRVGFAGGRSIGDLASMLERSAPAVVARLMEKDFIPFNERSAYLDKYPKKTQSE